jgi:hypothetical protein
LFFVSNVMMHPENKFIWWIPQSTQRFCTFTLAFRLLTLLFLPFRLLLLLALCKATSLLAQSNRRSVVPPLNRIWPFVKARKGLCDCKAMWRVLRVTSDPLREQRPFGFHSHKTGLEKFTCFYNELFKCL